MKNIGAGNTPAMADRVVVKITAEHHIGLAQRSARSLAEFIGLSQVPAYSVATAVSELANNIFFHADNGGTITLSDICVDGKFGMEVVAADDGPGITDVKLAMQDGFTTNGGLGGGLPGVERLMDEFEIESSAGSGTRVVARKWQTCPVK